MPKTISLQSFLIMAGAVIVGLFLFSMFSKQTITDNRGNTVGTSKTSAKMPKAGKSKGRTAAGRR